MKNEINGLLMIFLTVFAVVGEIACSDDKIQASSPSSIMNEEDTNISLPAPKHDSDVSIEESIVKRRSVRDFSDKPLSIAQVSQLLWAAQGTTSRKGGRTAPSAGALYPLVVYAIVGNVQNLDAGIYQYDPKRHEVVVIAKGDIRSKLASAALGQGAVKNGAMSIVLAAVYQRTTVKYGDRGIQYVHMEAGHAGQNVCLQATAMSLGAVTIGAFYDEEVSRLLDFPKGTKPLYIIPVGHRSGGIK